MCIDYLKVTSITIFVVLRIFVSLQRPLKWDTVVKGLTYRFVKILDN